MSELVKLPLQEPDGRNSLKPFYTAEIFFGQVFHPNDIITPEIWEQLSKPKERGFYEDNGPYAFLYDDDRLHAFFRFIKDDDYADYSLNLAPFDAYLTGNTWNDDSDSIGGLYPVSYSGSFDPTKGIWHINAPLIVAELQPLRISKGFMLPKPDSNSDSVILNGPVMEVRSPHAIYTQNLQGRVGVQQRGGIDGSFDDWAEPADVFSWVNQAGVECGIFALPYDRAQLNSWEIEVKDVQ